MRMKAKLIKVYPTDDPKSVAGVALLRLPYTFLVDFRIFEKDKQGLRPTERGAPFLVEDVPSLVRALVRALEVAEMWALVSDDGNSESDSGNGKSKNGQSSNMGDGTVVKFPKGKGRKKHDVSVAEPA